MQSSALDREITELLQRYLMEDNISIKGKLRTNLEDLIENYLSIVPNKDKFCFKETYNIILESASHLRNFSALRAAVGWNAILSYATNLAAQPWRREFYTIRMFSGYYKHNVENNLEGAWRLLEVLGYKKCGNKLEFSLPLDPDALIEVARDALVAYVECHMIQSMWEELRERRAVYTWNHLLRYRMLNICSVKSGVSELVAMYQHHIRQNMQLHDVYDSRYNMGFVQQPMYGPRYMTDGYSVPISYYNPYIAPLPYMHPVPVPYCNVVGPSMYQTEVPPVDVPTAQLIEVERDPAVGGPPLAVHPQSAPHMGPGYSQVLPVQTLGSQVGVPTRPIRSPSSTPRTKNGYVSSKNSAYATVDKSRNYDSGKSGHRNQTNRQENQLAQSPTEYEPESSVTVGNWDYVFRDLENQGYTKDVGERGDLLRSSGGEADRRLNESVQRLHINDRDSSGADCRASVYDNMPSPSQASQVRSPAREEVPEEGTYWQCEFCTLHNTNERTVCEACGRSRNRGPEEQPLASGGPECPQCTLVNKKDAVKCEACETELKGSPTYV